MTAARPQALIVDEADNVATLLADAKAGDTVACGSEEITLCADIPFGHKVARQAIEPGELIIKYGTPIGVAAASIPKGEHVHTSNVLGLNADLRGEGV